VYYIRFSLSLLDIIDIVHNTLWVTLTQILNNVALKNILYRMYTNPSKQEFDILYEVLVETNDAIRAWLKAEPKEK